MWIVALFIDYGYDFSDAKLFDDKRKAESYARRKNNEYAKINNCKREDLGDYYTVSFIPIAKEKG